MAELTEGEESSGVVFPAIDDGVGIAGGLGQRQQQQQRARVSGLLKNEMSALPSLAGFGMGGSVSFGCSGSGCDCHGVLLFFLSLSSSLVADVVVLSYDRCLAHRTLFLPEQLVPHKPYPNDYF